MDRFSIGISSVLLRRLGPSFMWLPMGGLDVRSQMDTGPKWQLLTARIRSGMAQSEFATATASLCTRCKTGSREEKCPAGAAQSLLKLVSRHPELLAELQG